MNIKIKNNKISNNTISKERNTYTEKKEFNNTLILKEIDSLQTKNLSLTKKYQNLHKKEKYINQILYFDSLENLGNNYINKEIIYYRKSHDYLTKEFFNVISKLKCEIRKNK